MSFKAMLQARDKVQSYITVIVNAVYINYCCAANIYLFEFTWSTIERVEKGVKYVSS